MHVFFVLFTSMEQCKKLLLFLRLCVSVFFCGCCVAIVVSSILFAVAVFFSRVVFSQTISVVILFAAALLSLKLIKYDITNIFHLVFTCFSCFVG